MSRRVEAEGYVALVIFLIDSFSSSDSIFLIHTEQRNKMMKTK